MAPHYGLVKANLKFTPKSIIKVNGFVINLSGKSAWNLIPVLGLCGSYALEI
jgi:hypothetical protein